MIARAITAVSLRKRLAKQTLSNQASQAKPSARGLFSIQNGCSQNRKSGKGASLIVLDVSVKGWYRNLQLMSGFIDGAFHLQYSLFT